MEHMKIETNFTNKIISKILSKLLSSKLEITGDITINEISVDVSDGTTAIHLDCDGIMATSDLLRLVKDAGLL